MTSMLLPIIEHNAGIDLAAAVPLVLQRRMPRDRMHIVWRSFQRRGICALLLNADADGFHADLQRSATFYAYYLQRIADLDEIATSEATPFFDALACNDGEAVRAIARHAGQSWNTAYEYEDDFLYMHVLMRLASGADPRKIDALLDRFAGVIAREESARYDLCRSLRHRDREGFEDALSRLVAAHEVRYREGKEEGYLAEEEWATDGVLFLEGLALVSLAEQLGFSTEADYQFIPSLARRREPLSHDPDVWQAG